MSRESEGTGTNPHIRVTPGKPNFLDARAVVGGVSHFVVAYVIFDRGVGLCERYENFLGQRIAKIRRLLNHFYLHPRQALAPAVRESKGSLQQTLSQNRMTSHRIYIQAKTSHDAHPARAHAENNGWCRSTCLSQEGSFP